MHRFVQLTLCMFGLSAATGCHHHERHYSYECDTNVRTVIKERFSEHSHRQPECHLQQCEPPVVVQPACPEPLPVQPPCHRPISVNHWFEVWETVCVSVPSYRTIWDCRSCRWVTVQCGFHTEQRRVLRRVCRPVTAYWDNNRQCYGFLDQHGCWQRARY